MMLKLNKITLSNDELDQQIKLYRSRGNATMTRYLEEIKNDRQSKKHWRNNI